MELTRTARQTGEIFEMACDSAKSSDPYCAFFPMRASVDGAQIALTVSPPVSPRTNPARQFRPVDDAGAPALYAVRQINPAAQRSEYGDGDPLAIPFYALVIVNTFSEDRRSQGVDPRTSQRRVSCHPQARSPVS